ncbi:MAG: glucokinase [Betaproteobacteria bacterium]|nr:glucokinase [Betaproteobacteria bacterium]
MENTVLGKSDYAAAKWLTADIGGTTVRFALLSEAGQLVGSVGYLRCADFPGPEAAARDFLRSKGDVRLTFAAFAVAAAVTAHDSTDAVMLTNSFWEFSKENIKSVLGLEHLLVINDFEALALALPTLHPRQYQVFSGPASLHIKAPMAVIGPGTGLGVAGVIPTHNDWIAVAGEGGHTTLAATDDFEIDVLRVIRGKFSHVSAERLLSGIGLPTLYWAVAQVHGERVDTLAPDQITQLALGNDAYAARTIDLFCGLLGSFAGNVALTFGARGGVYIGGGIVPKLGELFVQSSFRERFEAKGRFREYLEAIPTPLLVAPDVALIGAGQAIAAFLSNQKR